MAAQKTKGRLRCQVISQPTVMLHARVAVRVVVKVRSGSGNLSPKTGTRHEQRLPNWCTTVLHMLMPRRPTCVSPFVEHGSWRDWIWGSHATVGFQVIYSTFSSAMPYLFYIQLIFSAMGIVYKIFMSQRDG